MAINTKTVELLVQTKKQIADLEKIEQQLTQEVLGEMQHDNLKTVEAGGGLITRIQKVSYEYSPQVKSALESVTALKRKEEETGVAVTKISEYVRVSLD